jgi:hypothetical protein
MTDQNGSAINDRELHSYIITTLRATPEELSGVDALIVAQRTRLKTAQAVAENAELDAKINAVVTGKNAEERKLLAEQAVAASPAVKAARDEIISVEQSITEFEIDQKKLSRQFQAAMALAELQAARTNLMSTYNRKETVR